LEPDEGETSAQSTSSGRTFVGRIPPTPALWRNGVSDHPGISLWLQPNPTRSRSVRPAIASLHARVVLQALAEDPKRRHRRTSRGRQASGIGRYRCIQWLRRPKAYSWSTDWPPRTAGSHQHPSRACRVPNSAIRSQPGRSAGCPRDAFGSPNRIPPAAAHGMTYHCIREHPSKVTPFECSIAVW